jgi:hypothetical protein
MFLAAGHAAGLFRKQSSKILVRHTSEAVREAQSQSSHETGRGAGSKKSRGSADSHCDASC